MVLIRHLGLSHMAIPYAGNQGQAGVGFGDSGSPTSPWLTKDLGLRTGVHPGVHQGYKFPHIDTFSCISLNPGSAQKERASSVPYGFAKCPSRVKTSIAMARGSCHHARRSLGIELI